MNKSVMAVALCLLVSESHALDVNTHAHTPTQIGQTQNVSVGLAVVGRTDTQLLTVMGAFEVRCPQSERIEAQKGVQSSQMLGGFSITLTIPGMLPAQYPIPGWPEWATPSTKGCVFVYVGRAREALVTLNTLGLTTTLGGGEVFDGDTKVFNMVKPVPSTGSGTCNQ